MIIGVRFCSHGLILKNWSCPNSNPCLGSCSSGIGKTPDGSFSDEEGCFLSASLCFSLFLAFSLCSWSIKMWFGCFMASAWGKGNEVITSSSFPAKEFVSEDERGELGRVWFILASISALCSNTLSEVAFLYILQSTTFCDQKRRQDEKQICF